MNKPTKPNIVIPESFAENGIKTDFDNEKLTNGFDRLQPDVLAGDNLNKFIDDTYKGLNYSIAGTDAINLIQEGETLTVKDGQLVSGSTGGGLELCDIGTALYVDETKGLRRRLNGSIMDITSNYQAFLTRLKEITTLYPSLVCTEEEWQTTKTMSKLGQCGKFVYNYGADGTTVTSIRLPLVININGLVDMANAGLIKDESLPNITGTVCSGSANQGYGEKTGAFTYTSNIIGTGSGGGADALITLSFDASRVSSTYQDNAPVQQEAIQYPYFIQIATGSETENNIVNDIELNNPYSLFDSKYSDHELNNLSWLKSEGQWNAKSVYTDAYDKLLKVYNGTETVEGLSVKLSTETYTDYDFVLNTAEETFRLPLKTKLASGNRVVGNGMGLGLRSYNFEATLAAESVYNNDGVLRPKQPAGQYIADTPTSGSSLPATQSYIVGVVEDPTKSGMELSDSDLYLYYYVGETVQNANLIDAGRIGEQLANKIDMLQASGASMPSNKYIDLVLGASGTEYTAPANGYFTLSKYSSSNGKFLQVSQQSGIGHRTYAPTGGDLWITSEPIIKGKTISITYTANGKVNLFRFYYAEGEV